MSGEEDVCQIRVINKEKVHAVKGEMLEEKVFIELSETFKALGDKTRLKILHALSKEELCVCDLSTVFGMTMSAISHQLRILRNMRLVKYRKEGRIVYYSLDDDHIVHLLQLAYAHLKE
jgi:ArsR family transcriptional regulator